MKPTLGMYKVGQEKIFFLKEKYKGRLKKNLLNFLFKKVYKTSFESAFKSWCVSFLLALIGFVPLCTVPLYTVLLYTRHKYCILTSLKFRDPVVSARVFEVFDF